MTSDANERTNQWLAERLEQIRVNHFKDVPVKNRLQVRFGRIVKSRLGSITTRRLKGQEPISLISLNGLFKQAVVPEYVIDAVLAHEFVHYSHGFHSPLPRLYAHPHKDGIVDREIKQRGLADPLRRQQQWVKQHFGRLYLQHAPTRRRLGRRRLFVLK